MSTSRPELGNLRAGDEVFVRRSPNDMRRRDEGDWYIPARVVKAARVWIDLESQDGQAWRMRRDAQREGTQYTGSNASFVTPDQRRWDDRLSGARAFLRDQGIEVRMRSPWLGREVELADLIKAVLA